MKHSRFGLSVATVFFCTLVGVALSEGARPVTAATQAEAAMAEDAQRGQKVFASSCGVCHGPGGKGSAMGTSLIDSSLVRHDKGGDLISVVVHNGRPEKGMPPFPGVEAAQIADIAAFLHARIAQTDSVETAGPRGGYQLQHLLTGNAEAGKRFFDGAGGCVTCHSATRDLAGLAKKYQPAELEARFLYPRGAKAKATVTLPSGKVVKGTVEHADPFHLSLTDTEGQYHSWSLPGVKFTLEDPLQAHVTLLDRYTNKDVHDVFAYLETLQ